MNTFYNIYDTLTKLYEDVSSVAVTVKGTTYKFVTPFMPVSELVNSEYCRKSGIYIWERVAQPNKRAAYYVGQAENILKRTKEHLLKRKNDSKALHDALRLYPIEAFKIAIIELCPKADLSDREIYWIDTLRTFKDTPDYNLTPGGSSGGYYKITFEMLDRIIPLLQDTSKAAKPFSEIAALVGDEFGCDISWYAISDVNQAVPNYIQQYLTERNLDISFPIRSVEDVRTIIRNYNTDRSIESGQAKNYELFVTTSSVAADGKIITEEPQSLGVFTSRGKAWDHLCEIERTKYNTPENIIASRKASWNKGESQAAASFEPLGRQKFARRYTRREIDI